MSKKLSTAETGLPQYVLDFVTERKKEGFSYFEKSPDSYDKPSNSADRKWHPLTEKGIELADGEFWGIRYDNGLGNETYQVCRITPPEIVEMADKHIAEQEKKKTPRKPKHQTKTQEPRPTVYLDSENYIKELIEEHKARSQMRHYQFHTMKGEFIDITSNEVYVENHLKEWKNRDEDRGLKMESRKDAKHARPAYQQLAAAVAELEEAEVEISPTIWQAIERAFRAGQHSAAIDHQDAVLNAAGDAATRRGRGQKGKTRSPMEPKGWELEAKKAKDHKDATPQNLFDTFLAAGWIIKHPKADKFKFTTDRNFAKRASIEQKIRRKMKGK